MINDIVIGSRGFGLDSQARQIGHCLQRLAATVMFFCSCGPGVKPHRRALPFVARLDVKPRIVSRYNLYFSYRGRVHHCRIHSQQEKGGTFYYLVQTLVFDSLYSLIWHYQRFPLRNAKVQFELLLTEPVPQPNAHENKE